MVEEKFSIMDALEIGNSLGLDWDVVRLSEFHMGLNVELEHGSVYQDLNVTDDHPVKTAKIVLAHLRELPDYYTRLREMEQCGAVGATCLIQ